MNNVIKLSTFLLIGFAIVTGCEKHPSKSTSEQLDETLTMDELTRLLHLHTIKMAVPQSQRPFSQIRIVLVKPDGAVVLKGGVGMGDNTNSPTCKIIVGYRIEGETFSGQIDCQESNSSTGGDFTFTDSFANHLHEFGTEFAGSADTFKRDGYWKNGFLQLAADGPPGSTNNTILAVQLAK